MTLTAANLQPSVPFVAPAPTPRQLPVVGALPGFLRDLFGFLRQAQAQHGDIYLVDVGVLRMVILSHPRYIEHVLINQASSYHKSGLLLQKLLGNGLFISEGSTWLRQRRLIQPQFHRQRLAGLTAAMVQTIDSELATWEAATAAQSTNRPLNMESSFAGLMLQVMARTLFGQALDAQELVRVQEAIAYILTYLMVGGPLTCRLAAWLPRPGWRRYQAACRTLDEVIYQVIARERNATHPSDSMLTMLLQLVDEVDGTAMTDQQLRDEIMTFLMAGYETTSLALAWAVHLLTRHPDVLGKVEAEVAQVLDGRLPTFSDVGALRYTRMALQETLRLRPPAWWLTRKAVADDTIDGYAIPAGTTVVNFVYGLHHNAQVWADPEHFDPERFAPDTLAQQPKQAWVPFGAGQRQCIGRDFSLIEAQLVLAMLLQRYTLQTEPGTIAQPKISTTLRPKGGVQVKLAKRCGALVAKTEVAD